MNKKDLIINLSGNYSKIISIDIIKENKNIYWGGNGVGDRFVNKLFNYELIYKNGKTKKYSENEDDKIDDNILKDFILNYKNINNGIIGIFIYSLRTNIKKRPIRKDIIDIIKKQSCVCCGSKTDIICDHKNDLYNDPLVLNIKTQKITDFQPLCNHCNLQKRQICKEEIKNNKIYSIKNIPQFKYITFEIPFEKKAFDINNKLTKIDTYWYDPIEFNDKIYLYIKYILPIINEIKFKNNYII